MQTMMEVLDATQCSVKIFCFVLGVFCGQEKVQAEEEEKEEGKMSLYE